jgi:hypothetical protein
MKLWDKVRDRRAARRRRSEKAGADVEDEREEQQQGPDTTTEPAARSPSPRGGASSDEEEGSVSFFDAREAFAGERQRETTAIWIDSARARAPTLRRRRTTGKTNADPSTPPIP